MSFFTVARAIVVRAMFATHGLISVWRLHVATGDARYWYIICMLILTITETVITIHKKRGNEWKWFCPSVFLYLMTVVPAIWFLELSEFERRITHLRKHNISTAAASQGHYFMESNDTAEDMATHVDPLGIESQIPLKLKSDEWVRILEQTLLLFLIVGRWMLPKGKLTHDQLSQLLLVYIGTAADIVEFFEAFKEDQVRYNKLLCQVILGIWSWSLLQFAMVLTATKARKDLSGLVSKKFPPPEDDGCCTPDVYGIVISISLQDAPFLVLRLLLIFKYQVVSYTNMFFTCKNTLVILLLLYRLIVVQWERRIQRRKSTEYLTMCSESSSRVRLVPNSYSVDTYYSLVNKSKANLREYDEPHQSRAHEVDDDPKVNYVIKRHYSRDKMESEDSTEMKALQDCFDLPSDYEDDDTKAGLEDVTCDLGRADDVYVSDYDFDDDDKSQLNEIKIHRSCDKLNNTAATESPTKPPSFDKCALENGKGSDKSSIANSVYDNVVDVKL